MPSWASSQRRSWRLLSTWLIFQVTAKMPGRQRARALLGTGQSIIDLAVPVDPDRDRIRGPEDSGVTVVESGDFECPYCGRAEPVLRELLRDFGDVRYVWRHLPLNDVHRRPSWRPKPLRPRPCKGPSGRCTTGCSSIRGPWAWLI